MPATTPIGVSRLAWRFPAVGEHVAAIDR